MNFDLFVKDIEENDWNVFGVEVYENGKLKYNYGDTEGLHQIYSATKTVLSVAVGIAYDEKRIDIDKSILEYLPEDKYKNLSKKSYDIFSRITIRRLLTMSVDGFPFRAEGDNWLDFALNCDEIDPDKVTFNYSNISAYLVGVALDKAFGCDLGKVIEERILKPMDIVDYEYERSPEGYFYGASKMLLSVHDLSKFGLILFNKGIYNGKRIISSEYVDLATSTQQMNREGGYGFYIWMYRGGFSINGKLKQKCYILPRTGLIVTYLSHIEDDSCKVKESMEKHIFGIDVKENKAFARIASMEEIYDRVRSGSGTSEDLKTLEKYLSSPDWKYDFMLDEKGLIPAGLKRGVLSEDGIYNLLEEYNK
ncbi:DUF4298 domain-containing protein [Eubacterium ruminantium]|uniref:DUF4298 domain-containing protein n=1 Tax=Eubacterium ruminantium TaxID=42322 RepID=UPI0024792E4C|nr:DUF4298 domain-containing protein [Eubacterium ruminantium]